MRNYEKMSKTDLRAACKAAGISYGKMSVAEMRETLAARAARNTAPAPVTVEHSASNRLIAAAIARDPEPAAVVKPKLVKVQREQRNGVKKPGPGKCLNVWEAMQALYEKTGRVPTAKDASDWATANKVNVSNATQELSRWRKFSGLTKPAKGGSASGGGEVLAQAA